MSDKNKEKVQELLENNSFKIKPIFLELFNYSFSHKPIEGDDDKFIGRENIISRIRSFISDSTSSSGAYLVSGFRGIGKTSVINKALEIYSLKKKTTGFFLLFILSIFTLFIDSSQIKEFKYYLFLGIIFSVLLIFTFIVYWGNFKKFFQNPKVMNKHKYNFEILLKKVIFYIISLIYIFFITNYCKIYDNHHKFWVIIAFSLLSYLNYLAFNKTFKYTRVPILGLIFTLSIIVIPFTILSEVSIFYLGIPFFIFIMVKLSLYIKNKLSNCMKAIKNKHIKEFIKYIKPIKLMNFISIFIFLLIIFKLILKELSELNLTLLLIIAPSILIIYILLLNFGKSNEAYKNTFIELKNYFAFKQILIVKVNLGKDMLTDKDVLKYTTSNLLFEYRNWRKDYFHIYHRIKGLIPYFMLFIFLIILSQKPVFKEFSINTIKDVGVHEYLPSQRLLELDLNIDSNLELIKNIYTHKNNINNVTQYIENIDRIKKLSSLKNGISKYPPNTKVKTSAFSKATSEIDYYLSTSYYHIRYAVLGDNFVDTIPPTINYLLFLFIFTTWLLFSIFDIFRFFGIITHNKIISDLAQLKDKIEASITIDKGMDMSIPYRNIFKFPVFKNKTSKYSPLDTKDIETELIIILNNIKKIPVIFTKLEPIIIYDELDKITPHVNFSIQFKEEENPQDFENYKTKRQENITGILSSLKSYLSSSAAKFIFIAGRDMYDAALAGISDRQSILDSIFHDNKIYVPSFYSEATDNSINDISSMTERYICKYLIPEDYDYKEGELPSMRIYYEYLRNKNSINEMAMKRIIFILNSLITYITYRSNGAPKKISTLFEEFIVPGSEKIVGNKNNKIFVSGSTESLYLSLTYYNQYRLSFISYLVTPIFFKLGSYIDEFSDKILVSISYLVDHIFKFHKHAFSSQNLSLTPEIIDINKEPEFRPFVKDILNELSVSHLRKILSGLHEFRFQSKIRSELSFLTKLNPLESAALNFTLDESLGSKRYFYNKLNKLKNNNKKENFIDSISFYHITIGDLHYYDQEYNEAIINYQEAVQYLNMISLKKLNVYQVIILVKNNLKLALAYEKDDRLKEAKLIYLKISEIIINKRNFPLKEIGLSRFIAIEDDENTLEKLGKDTYSKLEFKEFGEKIIIGRRKSKNCEDKKLEDNLYDIDCLETLYALKGNQLVNKIEKIPFYTNNNHLNIKLTTIAHIRLLHQPIISRLYLLEKASATGVNAKDIKRALIEFSYLIAPIDTKYHNILITEFYNKIGDLLYYKNKSIVFDTKECISYDAFYFYVRGFYNLLSKNDKDILTKKVSTKTYLDKKVFEKYSEDNVKKVYKFKEKILGIIIKQNPKEIRDRKDANYISAMANSIIDIIDSYYASINNNDKNHIEKIKMIKNLKKITDVYQKISEMFSYIGEYRLAKSQLIKALMLYVSHLEYEQEDKDKNKKNEFTKIANKTIDLIYKTYNYSTIPEKRKYRKIFSLDNDEKVLNFSSLYNEIREIQILRYLYELKGINVDNTMNGPNLKTLRKMYSSLQNSPNFPHKYTRVLEHKLRVKINKKLYEINNIKILKDIIEGKEDNNINEKGIVKDYELFLIIDSIGCITESIKTHEIMGTDYITTGNLTMAKIHNSMNYWTKKLSEKRKDDNNIDDYLIEILGTKKLRFLDKDYHYKKIKLFNDKAKEMHNQNTEYKRFISSKYYLDDDFNDNIVHFSIAGERFELKKERKKNKETLNICDIEMYDV